MCNNTRHLVSVESATNANVECWTQNSEEKCLEKEKRLKYVKCIPLI